MEKIESLFTQEELGTLEEIAQKNYLSLRELFNLFPEMILQAGEIPEIDGYKDSYLRTKKREREARMNLVLKECPEQNKTFWESSLGSFKTLPGNTQIRKELNP